jgi:dienelactone hydrolase
VWSVAFIACVTHPGRVLVGSEIKNDASALPSALFLASDFPRLAEGVDTGLVGEVRVLVWSTGQDEWRLASSDETLTLHFRAKPGDPAPSWHEIGKANLAAGRCVKIVVLDDEAAGRESPRGSSATAPDAKDREQKKAQSKKRSAAPVPAMVVLTQDTKPQFEPSLDLIRGRINTIEPSSDRRHSLVRTNQEGAEFQSPATAAAWRDRAAHLRDQMRVALGLWPMFPKTPLEPRVYGKLDRGDYTIEKIVLETFPGFTLSGNLYRPKGATGKAPGILCPHGHWEDGRMNPEVQQRCIRWAKLGCVVFMYDMVGYNDSKPFTHAFLNDRLRRWGLSLPTLQTWNSIRAVDWLTSLPDVDAARIGCTGESGGGTQTFLLTALDDRIAVSAPVVMVSHAFQGGCVCENAAGLRHGTDNVEFAALCAPRPLKLVGATGDWTALTMSRAFPAIRGVYALVGSTDRVSAEVFDFPHNYNQTSRNAIYGFMAHWLLGIDDSARTREGKQQPETASVLSTFDAQHPAPAGRKSPEQLESYLISELGRMIDELAPSAARSAQWDAARTLLQTSLNIRVGAVNPPPEQIVHHEVRRVQREGLTVIHSFLSRRQSGEAIPVVRLIPREASGRLTVVAHSRGQAALAVGSGEPSKLVQALLALGQNVVGFDPLFVGESLDFRAPVARRPETVHFETYNPVVAADQMQDLATVIAWAKAQPDVREINLIGGDLSGPQALLVRPLLEGIARTAIELRDLPDAASTLAYPPALDLPGLYQFGGFKAAASLAAPHPLWIYGGSSASAADWARSAYSLSGADDALRISTDEPTPQRIARWLDSGQ